MDVIERLTEIFKEFPGIGERQARRFVYFLMAKNPAYSEDLRSLIADLKKEVSQCKECFKFFLASKSKGNFCEICANPNTDSSTLMVVEKDCRGSKPIVKGHYLNLDKSYRNINGVNDLVLLMVKES